MTTRHGQNEVPVVERLEDRLLFSAGLTAATCPEAYVEKPCGHAEAFMEKPCVAAGLAGGDGCGGFSNVAIGREGKLLARDTVSVPDGGTVLPGGDRGESAPVGWPIPVSVAVGNDRAIQFDSWQTDGIANDGSNWSGTWPGMRGGGRW